MELFDKLNFLSNISTKYTTDMLDNGCYQQKNKINDIIEYAIRYKYLQSIPSDIPATTPIKVFLSKLDEYTDIAIK